MTRTVVIKIEIPEGVEVDVDYLDSVPQEPPHMAELPPVVAAPVAASAPITQTPQYACPQHGPMTYYAGRTKDDGTQVSPRYSCAVKVDGAFCKAAKTVWLKG
jgi:hypothetical protein